MTVENKEDTYILGTGKAASKKLDMQQEILREGSYKHLEKAGLSEGQVVWDIGCGGGAMTSYLAKVVGARGRVYAIDKSEELLEIARAKIKSEGLENVTFIQGDIRSQKDLSMGTADLIYMRFVLTHVKDPEVVINIGKNLLKDGGVALSQEPILSTYYNSSKHEIFREYVKAIADVGKKMGVDYDLGKRLLTLYEQAGYVETNVDYNQPQVKIAYVKETLPLDIAEWKDKAVALGVLTQEKAASWVQTIKDWPDDDTDSFNLPMLVYTIARKTK